MKLCADCISSVGLAPVNLEGVYLASAASGKGLAGYPGLCMVFHNHAIASFAGVAALPGFGVVRGARGGGVHAFVEFGGGAGRGGEANRLAKEIGGSGGEVRRGCGRGCGRWDSTW